ncbi:hypothetical protein SRAA_0211 [Serpentinimonas raichei]|uniref:Uncharacterized protein n=1 Tax=Serpentinimonas raichei TaxID=1458425 RepID=A0A060NH91_9BURK|nr:hypothetical protein [Serpentinimonas raichei]MBT9161467.1 hypothetical protein [Chloroflexota bacterium]BAO80065.1 hypothetical protein SRAA_0211 [Serpentinimonas raichei]
MEDAEKTELDEFLARTQALLADCEEWSVGLGLRVTHGETAINEERHGPYRAPTLILDDSHGKRMAQIVPFGASILGAWGRVDVVSEYSKQEKIVYLSAGGPVIGTRIQAVENGPVEQSSHTMLRGVEGEGWYWVSPFPLRRAYPLTREVFVDLLGAVSGHDFQL